MILRNISGLSLRRDARLMCLDTAIDAGDKSLALRLLGELALHHGRDNNVDNALGPLLLKAEAVSSDLAHELNNKVAKEWPHSLDLRRHVSGYYVEYLHEALQNMPEDTAVDFLKAEISASSPGTVMREEAVKTAELYLPYVEERYGINAAIGFAGGLAVNCPGGTYLERQAVARWKEMVTRHGSDPTGQRRNIEFQAVHAPEASLIKRTAVEIMLHVQSRQQATPS